MRFEIAPLATPAVAEVPVIEFVFFSVIHRQHPRGLGMESGLIAQVTPDGPFSRQAPGPAVRALIGRPAGTAAGEHEIYPPPLEHRGRLALLPGPEHALQPVDRR